MMTIRRLKRILALAIASLAAVVPLGPGTTVAQVPLGSLKTVPVPKPDLAGFVRDEATAVALGKALFWDMQLGSDGVQSCGSCPFHGGADNRLEKPGKPRKIHAPTTLPGAGPNPTPTAAHLPLA